MNKVELLAPVGNLEKLKFAVKFGADAVYLGGKKYGLRAFAGNFDLDEIEEGVRFAHENGVKVYITINIIPRNNDFEGFVEYVEALEEIGVDALIVSDPGFISLIRENCPGMAIHLSTQANCNNYQSALFWKSQGVERVVLARELSLSEIKEVKEKADMEVETFIHGAMCISYSGRCLLSNYMADRDANKGSCAQSCRWNYSLVEEKRPNEYYPVVQDERGTYVFNSQDLCMAAHINEIIDAGVTSLKIEGRMKSLYYVSTIVRAYRKIIDQYYNRDENFDYQYWINELEKVSHRPYTTGFYFNKLYSEAAHVESSKYIQPYDFVGIVKEYDEETKLALVEQRNNFKLGDKLEVFGIDTEDFSFSVEKILDKNGEEVEVVPTPKTLVHVYIPNKVQPFDLLRRKSDDDGVRIFKD